MPGRFLFVCWEAGTVEIDPFADDFGATAWAGECAEAGVEFVREGDGELGNALSGGDFGATCWAHIILRRFQCRRSNQLLLKRFLFLMILCIDGSF